MSKIDKFFEYIYSSYHVYIDKEVIPNFNDIFSLDNFTVIMTIIFRC